MAEQTATAAEFVLANVPARCTLKSSLVEFAALQRGLAVDRVSTSMILVDASSKMLPFQHMNGAASSALGKGLCDQKERQRALARVHGLPTVSSDVFGSRELTRGLDYAKSLGWPVVVKPTSLSRGRGVTASIQNEDEFREAWQRAGAAYRKPGPNRRVVVEKHFRGEDVRVFVVDGHVFSATHRARANVVGDGTSTVRELVRQKNRLRAGNPYLREHPIPEDEDELDLLRAAGWTLDYVAPDGERVVLRSKANIWAGGDSLDVTDSLAPALRQLAVDAVRIMPGLPYCGVDIITSNIEAIPEGDEYVVSEVEYSPAPLAQFPFTGEERDMAGAVLDYYLRRV